MKQVFPKLHLFCSSDKINTRLNYIQVKDGYINATDAHILCRIPVHSVFGSFDNMPEEFYIHKDEFKKLCSVSPYAFRFEQSTILGIGKKGSMIIEYKTKESVNIQFPDVTQVLPDFDNRTEEYELNMPFIGFNTELIARINQAMGWQFVQCNFQGSTKPMIITNADTEGGFILVMPVMITNIMDSINRVRESTKKQNKQAA
jgi:hypothetical protein